MGFRDWVPSISSSTDPGKSTAGDSNQETGVVRGEYGWEDYLEEYSPGEFRSATDSAETAYDDLPNKYKHDEITPASLPNSLHNASRISNQLSDVIDRNTVNIEYENEEEFFTNTSGIPTVVSRYDLERAVPDKKKQELVEINRYWVNKPFAFIIIFRSTKENEIKYFAVEPHVNLEEKRILNFLKNKLQDTIKFSEEVSRGERSNPERSARIEEEAYKLLFRYDLISKTPFEENSDEKSGEHDEVGKLSYSSEATESTNDASESGDDEDENSSDSGGLFSFSSNNNEQSIVDKLVQEEIEKAKEEATPDHVYTPSEKLPNLDGEFARPERNVINEGATELTDYQVVKLSYYLKRDSVSYGKIDPIKHDIHVEDISCDGYNMRVWVYHGDHEQIISNIQHGEQELDDFVVNLAQRAGQGISKRQPQVDITLPDGSRGQLTLGAEVSDHGTNYTIRQFNDVPFTPIDLINWKTFSPEQMAFLWLCIENHKSLIFAGGTASGKTTSLNAVSLFIPSNTKIVSIEDTREVELPQRNWVASVTRSSFTEDGVGEVDEFSLLEAALRQRPDYIVMGEIRGEEGRTLFQVMSTGHTTYTTFHADSVGEVIKRFTTDPINVSKTLFTALDLVSIQTATRVDGNKVRRNKALTEINNYSAETDEINVNDVYQWIAEDDNFEQTENSQILNTIQFDRGWDEDRLDRELRKREVVIAYLIWNRINTYREVAATVQAFINGPDVVLGLIANEVLEESLENLRDMESVAIDIDPEKEAMVPRPDPPEDILKWAKDVLDREKNGVLEDKQEIDPDGKIADLLRDAEPSNANQAPSGEQTGTDDVDDGFSEFVSGSDMNSSTDTEDEPVVDQLTKNTDNEDSH